MPEIIFVFAVCIFSASSFAAAIFYRQKLAALSKIHDLTKKAPVKSIEAQQILHDMTKYGCSIIKITPICPEDLFWRSSR